MKRARLCDVDLAASQLRRCRNEPGRSLEDRVSALILCREYLGSGPLTGPKIEEAWGQVANAYATARDTLLKELLLNLRLPSEEAP